jgi:hypothetical protein
MSRKRSREKRGSDHAREHHNRVTPISRVANLRCPTCNQVYGIVTDWHNGGWLYMCWWRPLVLVDASPFLDPTCLPEQLVGACARCHCMVVVDGADLPAAAARGRLEMREPTIVGHRP